MLEKLNTIDTRLFLWLNSFHSPRWDNIMWFVSGKAEWIPLYVLLIAYLIYRFRRQSILIICFAAVAVVVADQLAVHAFKEVIQRLRPTHEPALQSMVHIVNNYSGGTYGFVSNHAANSFALATFLVIIFKSGYVAYLLFFWATLVSYSRIYLGVHYPGDVICGAILGILIGWLMYSGYRSVNRYVESRQKLNK